MTEYVWREVSCQKAVNGAEFERGVQDYNFSVGQPTAWIPSKSYFKVDMRLHGPGGNKPSANDASKVAFADNAVACLYNNVYFRAGGQDVSSCVNYVPQIAAARTRLQKSYAWQKSIGKGAYMVDASFDERYKRTTADLPATELVELDESSNIISAIWQPPIGIFDYKEPIGAGDYRIQLNPNSNYKKACVESDQDLVIPTDYDITIDSVRFYVCTVKKSIAPGTEQLHLLEGQAQSKTLTGTSNSLQFGVPSSTRALTVFIQSGSANNIVPPTKFACLSQEERNLRSLQITYANCTKPSTRWASEFATGGGTGDINRVQQRFLETQLESGLAFSEGGTETLAEYIERGMMYHFTFAKDALDKSTAVEVSLDLSAIEANSNVFLIAWHSRTTAITTSNGIVVEVNSLNT